MGNKYGFIEMVKQIEDKFGYQPYEILSTYETYETKKSKVTFKCKKCGYVFDYAPGELLRPRNDKPVCKQCRINEQQETRGRKGRVDFFAKLEEAYPNAYTYDKSEYKNVKTKMNFTCNTCNNVVGVTPGNILNNIRGGRDHYCPTCSNQKMSKLKLNVDSFKERLEKKFPNRYEIKDYNGGSNECTFVCKDCNHEFQSKGEMLLSYRHFYCPNCSSDYKHDSRDYLTRCFEESHGRIVPIEKFVSNKTKILHKCTKCDNEWMATPNNVVVNHTSCPKCSNSYVVSKGELELRDYIKSIYDGEIILNSRSIIKPRELDIYIPEHKVAIEYCGLYWHNEQHKGKEYHLEKLEECRKQGIRLITLFEDEWLKNKELVKSKLLHLLKLSKKTKINARKCTVKVIGKPECDRLLDDNHLQGADRATIRLGLYHGDILVSAMTFCKPRVSTGSLKSKEKVDYELSRFVTDTAYIVNGGFGRLFSYFKNNYEWNSIITYADLRWSDGNLYFKGGFTHTHDSKPSYFYVDRNDGTARIHRYMYRKDAIKKNHPEVYNEALTEREMTKALNLYRIYDCGNMVFTYKR